jgi:pilus assembly protein Flp/PilA
MRSKGVKAITNFFKKLRRNEDGATAIEYGLLAALIAVVIIGGVSVLGGTLKGVFENVNTELTQDDSGNQQPAPVDPEA